MRKTLAVLLLFAALGAHAETINDVIVEARPGVAPLRDGTYFEFRFDVMNPTAGPRRVRITVQGRTYNRDVTPGATREVVVAPRSTVLVSIPQYVVTDYSPHEALIDVDGEQGKLSLSGYASQSFRAPRDILVGRTVAPDIVTSLIPNEETGTEIRATLSPASWSSNWLHYGAFSGMVLTTQDWRELPRPVQMAVLRWVAGGGSLTFVGGADGLPPLRPASLSGIVAGHHGFGFITLVPPALSEAHTIASIRSTWRPVDLDTRHMWWGQTTAQEIMPVKLLDEDALPVKSLFSLLVVFAIVGGPINLWVLAKKQRRLWIFWTLPILGVITAAVVIGAVIATEGWVRIQKTISLTLLDERIGEAVTLGWTGLYATLPPEGEVRFDSATDVRPMFVAPDASTDWTDGQRFLSGWIGSRVPSGFTVRKVEPRRERLPLRREGGHLVAVNGLGSELRELWVADDSGTVYKATNVAAGKEIVLTATDVKLDPGVRDPALLYTAPGVWPTYFNRIAAQPRSVLLPNTYVAVLKKSPFVEAALARPTKTTAEGVVIGLVKGIDHAS